MKKSFLVASLAAPFVALSSVGGGQDGPLVVPNGWAYAGKNAESGECRFVGAETVGPGITLRVLRTTREENQATFMDVLQRENKARKQVEDALKERGISANLSPPLGAFSVSGLRRAIEGGAPFYPHVMPHAGGFTHVFTDRDVFGERILAIADRPGESYAFTVSGNPVDGHLFESRVVSKALLAAINGLEHLKGCAPW